MDVLLFISKSRYVVSGHHWCLSLIWQAKIVREIPQCSYIRPHCCEEGIPSARGPQSYASPIPVRQGSDPRRRAGGTERGRGGGGLPELSVGCRRRRGATHRAGTPPLAPPTRELGGALPAAVHVRTSARRQRRPVSAATCRQSVGRPLSVSGGGVDRTPEGAVRRRITEGKRLQLASGTRLVSGNPAVV